MPSQAVWRSAAALVLAIACVCAQTPTPSPTPPCDTSAALYVWTNAWNASQPGCDAMQWGLGTVVGTPPTCMQPSWQNPTALAELIAAATAGDGCNRFAQVMLSGVSTLVQPATPTDCNGVVAAAVTTARAAGLRVLGLLAASDAAFSEQTLVDRLVAWNARCPAARFDGVSSECPGGGGWHTRVNHVRRAMCARCAVMMRSTAGAAALPLHALPLSPRRLIFATVALPSPTPVTFTPSASPSRHPSALPHVRRAPGNVTHNLVVPTLSSASTQCAAPR
jgi:hypothetical protein